MAQRVKITWFSLPLLLILSALFSGGSPRRPGAVRLVDGVEFLPVAGVAANYGGRCWWAGNRFIMLLPGADSSLEEFIFISDSNAVIHNGRKLNLPIPALVEKNQLYLPAVVLAAIFPQLAVPTLSGVEADNNKDTLILRLFLDPLQRPELPLLYHKEKRSSLELRLTLGARTDSGFVQQLSLVALIGGGQLLNRIELDTSTIGVHLLLTFRQPVSETIVSRANGTELRIRAKPPRHVRRVILDPGHGGKDPGAVGALGAQEKDIVLDIARRVKKHLNEAGIEVVLTRDGDDYVTLAERAERAAKANAELFVSIHANAAPNRRARGVETYFLSEAKTDWERAVAARENEVFERELQNPFIRGNDPVGLILADLAQNEFLIESSELAARIQAAALDAICAEDRGVRQANFYVLRNIFMPAVLVECGFITNKQEEKLLRQIKHREKVARAIARGIINFIPDYEKRLNGARK